MVLRVGTYNIRHGMGLDEKVDLDRVAEVIRGLRVDIIGLQELDKGWRRSGRVDQAQHLARLLGMNYVFAPGLNRGTAQFGNAVLSRYPVVFWEAYPMKSLREPRVLLRAVIEFEGRRINFYTTHLGLNQRERLRHIEEILVPALRSGRHIILTGDFNCLPESLEMIRLTQVLQDACPPPDQFTFPSHAPRERIDYILYSGGLVREQVVVHQADASDHNPLIAVFNLA